MAAPDPGNTSIYTLQLKHKRCHDDNRPANKQSTNVWIVDTVDRWWTCSTCLWRPQRSQLFPLCWLIICTASSVNQRWGQTQSCFHLMLCICMNASNPWWGLKLQPDADPTSAQRSDSHGHFHPQLHLRSQTVSLRIKGSDQFILSYETCWVQRSSLDSAASHR